LACKKKLPTLDRGHLVQAGYNHYPSSHSYKNSPFCQRQDYKEEWNNWTNALCTIKLLLMWGLVVGCLSSQILTILWTSRFSQSGDQWPSIGRFNHFFRLRYKKLKKRIILFIFG
jgi:hypothetical protein